MCSCLNQKKNVVLNILTILTEEQFFVKLELEDFVRKK